jgi:hypothetical protein
MAEKLVVLCVDSVTNIPQDFTGIAQLSDGSKLWRLNGSRHREDGPAIEWADGDKEWWLNGKRHCKDGPAIEYADGTKKWAINGLLHREDGPAVEWKYGDKAWYRHGIFVGCDSIFVFKKGEYIIVERGIPTNDRFGKLKLTHMKLLIANGIMFMPDNLPGMNIGEY